MYKEKSRPNGTRYTFGFVINGLEDENIGNVVDEYGTR